MRTEHETGEVIMTAHEERLERERIEETERADEETARADRAEQRVEELETGLDGTRKRFLEIHANCVSALAEISDIWREANRRT